MSIITLTTDWKANDFYVGAVKGAIISNCPDVTIIDITHQIQTYNVAQAAFILRNSYNHYPKGTIHIIGINSENSKKYPYVVIKADGHYFIGAANGIFGLMFDEKPDIIVKINNEKKLLTFPELSIFSKTACDLAKGKDILELGEKISYLSQQIPIMPAVDENVITGSIIYIDSYENAITNISQDLFNKVGENKKFDILIKSTSNRISKINSTYDGTSIGELLAIFNSLNLLEIAINKGKVCELLDLNINTTIRIKFYDNTNN
ncbi:MAG: SAM-dependent chlorinase/fluorinase [Bacteroidales bacterium]|nr:SAM-dependent chlorinase/fluorinase [Bacteroidales bacterium]